MGAVNSGMNSPSRKIAYGGILGALVLLTLFLATVLPTSRLFLYGISSVFIAVIIIEYGVPAGWLFFAATSLLALLVIPNKLRLIPYIVILGHYGIWKTYIERLNNRFFELLLKIAVVDIFTLLAYFAVHSLFFYAITIKINLILVFAGLQVLILIYDFAFTVFIRFYLSQIRPFITR